LSLSQNGKKQKEIYKERETKKEIEKGNIGVKKNYIEIS
jgi:hypothetical protein